MEVFLAVCRGTSDDKATFYFDWCAAGSRIVEYDTLRGFVSMVGSTAMGIHPQRTTEKYAYTVSPGFVDFVLEKPFAAKLTFVTAAATVSSSSSFIIIITIVDAKKGIECYVNQLQEDEAAKKPLTKDAFSEWYRKNSLFKTLSDLVFTRMFLRSKDVYHLPTSPSMNPSQIDYTRKELILIHDLFSVNRPR